MLTLARPVLLVGLPGAGKSTVGAMLAARLGCPFVDTDARVEQEAGRSVPEIFAEESEAGFRLRERSAVLRLLETEPQVIALGGGGFADEEVREAALKAATIFWLAVPDAVLAARLSSRGGRPLFEGGNVVDTLQAMASSRTPHYGLAHHHVRAQSSEEMTAQILAILRHSAPAAAGPGE